MNEYEATFSQDGRYITERRWPSPEHTYEIVNAVPLGYTVWNIGHPVAGEYLPLCRLSQHQPFPGGQSIDVDSLKAIRWNWPKISQRSGWSLSRSATS